MTCFIYSIGIASQSNLNFFYIIFISSSRMNILSQLIDIYRQILFEILLWPVGY